jgi:hypothetical protein
MTDGSDQTGVPTWRDPVLPHLRDHAFCPVQGPDIAVSSQEEGVGVLCRHTPRLQQSRVHSLCLVQLTLSAIRVYEQVVADDVGTEGAPVDDPLADLQTVLRNHTSRC